MTISGTFIGLLCLTLIAATLVVAWSRNTRNGKDIAPDREDLPYSIYTTDFDVTCGVENLPELLGRDGTAGEAPNGWQNVSVDERIDAFEHLRRAFEDDLKHIQPPTQPITLCVLLDMSGSMAGSMPETAAGLFALREWLLESGSECSVLGFTTRGWRGGYPREAWIEAGRPEYPGRLCALLHVRIADERTRVQSERWHPLLRPDVLRENVDGEALRWARQEIEASDATQRILVVLSDGAPVDDSTLMENGNSYLWRDLRCALIEFESCDAELHVVGVSHRLEGLYPNSHFVENASEVVGVLASICSDQIRGSGD